MSQADRNLGWHAVTLRSNGTAVPWLDPTCRPTASPCDGMPPVAPRLTMHFHLLIDPPQAGALEMALDEVLLEAAAADAQCWWRFYRWSQPTLSLGYFQDYGHRDQHAASRSCPAVRRLTGGGAILHDRELTYSFAVPIGHRLAAARDCLYEVVHRSLLAVLAQWSISLRRLGMRQPRTPRSSVSNAAQPATWRSATSRSPACPAPSPWRRAATRQRLVATFRRRPGTARPGRGRWRSDYAGTCIYAWLPKLAQALGMTGDATAISYGNAQRPARPG